MSRPRAAQAAVHAAKASDDVMETDDDLVRAWQEDLREAQEKMEVYRASPTIARTFGKDVRHTRALLASLPKRIAARRAEIADERWADRTFTGLLEIPIASLDRSFASVRKEDLARIAPELAIAIPKKSRLWDDWSVWNFRRRRLRRTYAVPAEALRRVGGSVAPFHRIEAWQAVGMADPWLVGGIRLASGRERFYLLYDWGLEETRDRVAFR